MSNSIYGNGHQLYPDWDAAGGLAPLVVSVLESLGWASARGCNSDPGLIGYARIEHGHRFSQFSVAMHERAFHADFWLQGFCYGGGWSATLEEVCRAVVDFVRDGVALRQMTDAYPWFEPAVLAGAHEIGPETFVEKSWERLDHWLSHEEPDSSCMKRIVFLVQSARKRPELACLLPFTSHDRLCFSRTTGYPYSNDIPILYPITAGQFAVRGQPGVLGEGSVEQVLDILVSHLPAGCGPARHGTAEDFPVS